MICTSTFASLIKVSFILTETLATHVTFTAPNPSPKHDERRKFGVEDMVTRLPIVRKIAVVVARQYPSAVSEHVISLLALNSAIATSRVRITLMFYLGCALATAGSYATHAIDI
ncbi:hypothetical protein AcV7_003768 [Taiwanofungus camphoratus]|nr:hypothetical protein AcV7_003768 [Antrodia cinnamomea]